jgi:signal transduction histidine kinase
VRYSHPQGEVRVSLQAVRDEHGRGHCEVCVVDAGIGISPDDLPHIFERNYRGALARLHRADGTGLGLAIGAVLARAHGGTVVVDSQPGHGTTARLRLPLLSEPALLLNEP